ncbi:hypothetical protein Tco_0150287 [Tanacetum coccineum]
MNDKMKDPECVVHKVKITPPDYSKENFLATFTPQKQLTPEQIFWSQDLIKMKAEALKQQTTTSKPIKELTVYPPNTPATLESIAWDAGMHGLHFDALPLITITLELYLTARGPYLSRLPCTPSLISTWPGGAMHAPPSPDYVPGAEHADDEIVAEDQPYAEDASPIAQSPDYVPESDPEADPEEDDDEDPEEDPIDYPADGGDDGDDEMDIEEDEDDDMDIEADEEDEEDDEMDVEDRRGAGQEEHLAPAYPVVVALPATAPSAEETEPFETDESAATPPPHPAYRMTARISIPEPLPVPAWSDSEVARLLAISSPPASPLSYVFINTTQISRSHYHHPHLAEAAATSHSLPLPPPFILSPTRPDAPPPLPTSAPTSFPPLLLPSDSHREGRPEVNLPPRMGLGIALGPRYEVGESSAAAAARPAGGLRADYGFVATMDRERAPVSTDTELGAHMREFESMVRRDTDEIYTRLDDEQGQRQLLAGRVNMLFRDRRTHAHTRQLMETEAGMSREAWGRAMDASDLAHGEVMSLRTIVHAQCPEIKELQLATKETRAMSYLARDRPCRRQHNREDGSHFKDCSPPAGQDKQGPAGVLSHPSYQRRLVAVLRLDFVILPFLYKPTKYYGIIPASKALGVAAANELKRKQAGTEGVVGLTRWFEKMESVFSISNCPATSQVKFATCTLQDDALTWWNAHVKTTTTEAAHAMTWAALKKMID